MSQQDFWLEHYRGLHPKKTELGTSKSMDYPNDRLQVQTYAQVLEALGRLNYLTLLDAGCGWGVLSLMAHCLGASVTCRLTELLTIVDAEHDKTRRTRWQNPTGQMCRTVLH
jgi:2-polyprenyl-3-methyl-5-hydroxy-6-metoxy-1,4-benzoquinol methylase